MPIPVCFLIFPMLFSVPYTLVYLEFFLSTAFTKIVCETDFFGLFLVARRSARVQMGYLGPSGVKMGSIFIVL